MISVADGDSLLPLPLGPSGSVSVSRSRSESGFVHIIRFAVVTLLTVVRESVEEKAEGTTDGRLVGVTVVRSALEAGKSCSGLERVVNEGGEIGESKMVYRRATRIGVGV
jgi:hypothetical protein